MGTLDALPRSPLSFGTRPQRLNAQLHTEAAAAERQGRRQIRAREHGTRGVTHLT